jgi:hypothetical protein
MLMLTCMLRVTCLLSDLVVDVHILVGVNYMLMLTYLLLTYLLMLYIDHNNTYNTRGRHGCDCMVFVFTTTCAISDYHH